MYPRSCLRSYVCVRALVCSRELEPPAFAVLYRRLSSAILSPASPAVGISDCAPVALLACIAARPVASLVCLCD